MLSGVCSQCTSASDHAWLGALNTEHCGTVSHKHVDQPTRLSRRLFWCYHRCCILWYHLHANVSSVRLGYITLNDQSTLVLGQILLLRPVGLYTTLHLVFHLLLPPSSCEDDAPARENTRPQPRCPVLSSLSRLLPWRSPSPSHRLSRPLLMMIFVRQVFPS